MSEDERTIRNAIQEWMDASKAGDTGSVLNLMAEDVLFLVPGREPFGKEAFATASQGLKDLLMEGRADIREVTVLGDWAWTRVHLAITITPPNGKPMQRHGYTLSIWRKQPGGHWVIFRDANLLATE
ncbi:MAG TPA: SgcJ/EcaC family oxidoreductase [Micropepsaceae bacterium]|jgi:uncharacterized protein (TIGR02246 family)|nr:SgcJ/EcaC family oxidoreductase [Micropepsaceae bacterium]